MKWNNLIKICEEHNLHESDVINCVNSFLTKGTRKKWISDRFDLFAKERIREYKLKCLRSKINTVRKVVNSKEYKELHKKYNINTKNDCVYNLSKLIAEKPSKERLLQAFKNNGEDKII
jgi:hypothetical protein